MSDRTDRLRRQIETARKAGGQAQSAYLAAEETLTQIEQRETREASRRRTRRSARSA